MIRDATAIRVVVIENREIKKTCPLAGLALPRLGKGRQADAIAPIKLAICLVSELNWV
jgi:hypothetical protein